MVLQLFCCCNCHVCSWTWLLECQLVRFCTLLTYNKTWQNKWIYISDCNHRLCSYRCYAKKKYIGILFSSCWKYWTALYSVKSMHFHLWNALMLSIWKYLILTAGERWRAMERQPDSIDLTFLRGTSRVQLPWQPRWRRRGACPVTICDAAK